jgi:hypothetical protein
MSAEAAKQPTTFVAKPQPVRISDRAFGVAEFKFRRWSAELTEEQSIEDALKPEFWANQADKLMGHDPANPKGRGDIIEIRKLDTGLYAELIVRSIGKGFIRCDVIRAQEPDAAVEAEDAPLKTKWNVGKRMHDVVRDDGQVMAGNFQTKELAVAWINDHLGKMAR